MVWNFDLPEMPAGPVMELHGARKRFHVPQGLKPLLEEMSLEVLREQPDNIYEFLAEYLRHKVGGFTPDNEEEEEEEEEDEEIEMKDEGVKKETYFTEDGVAVTLDEYGILIDPEGKALQSGTKLFTQSGKDITEDLQSKIAAESEDAGRYATVIQAAFKGYLVRKGSKAKANKEDEENEGKTFTTEDGITVTMVSGQGVVDADGGPVPPGTKLISATGETVIVNSAGKIVAEITEEGSNRDFEALENMSSQMLDPSGQAQEEWQTSEEEWSAPPSGVPFQPEVQNNPEITTTTPVEVAAPPEEPVKEEINVKVDEAPLAVQDINNQGSKVALNPGDDAEEEDE